MKSAAVQALGAADGSRRPSHSSCGEPEQTPQRAGQGRPRAEGKCPRFPVQLVYKSLQLDSFKLIQVDSSTVWLVYASMELTYVNLMHLDL